MIISSRPSNHKWRRPLAVILAVLILVPGGGLVSGWLSGGAISLSRPLWRLRSATAAIWRDLTAENELLRARLTQSELARWELGRLRAENELLRNQLGRTTATTTRQTARVIIGWREGPWDILLVDLGRDNAAAPLSVGAPVLAGEDLWLGRVLEVNARTSKIKLLSFAGDTLPAVIGPGRIEATLQGRGGGNFVATVPSGVVVQPGETALASLEERDWLVGVVGAVEPEPAGGEQRLYLRQPVRAITLPYVEIQAN